VTALSFPFSALGFGFGLAFSFAAAAAGAVDAFAFAFAAGAGAATGFAFAAGVFFGRRARFSITSESTSVLSGTSAVLVLVLDFVALVEGAAAVGTGSSSASSSWSSSSQVNTARASRTSDATMLRQFFVSRCGQILTKSLPQESEERVLDPFLPLWMPAAEVKLAGLTKASTDRRNVSFVTDVGPSRLHSLLGCQSASVVWHRSPVG
jgi:hypothetical protein